MKPQDLKWNDGNLPTPSLCHPDTRIIVWIETYHSNGDVGITLDTVKPIDTYWLGESGSAYQRFGLIGVKLSWAWVKSFHKDEL
jgi:hypothetical protein